MIPLVEYADREAQLGAVLSRHATLSPEIDHAVRAILADVQARGDAAVLALTERFDGVRPERLRVPPSHLAHAHDALDAHLRRILGEAAGNVRRFHEQQRQRSWFTDDPGSSPGQALDGVLLGQRVVPIERAGLYVPGGTAAYPSSVLMNAIPAQVAGVESIHVVSPPGPDGLPHPLVLATAHLLGLENVYAAGGAQAVAALAYGTATIPKVDKIVGPGNAYVAAAKRQVYGLVDIDSLAGPSEIVILAEADANPQFIAADLLSQAEHDVRASAILVTPDRALAEAVQREVETLAAGLPRRAIIEASLRDYGACVVTPSMDVAVDLVNQLAPEHLELLVANPWAMLTRIRHAGAVFLGPYSAEPVGDYFAGPNHVLPTGGTARYASALGVGDFLRRQSVIAYTAERLRRTGADIAAFAEHEGLQAHALAIRVRLDQLNDI